MSVMRVSPLWVGCRGYRCVNDRSTPATGSQTGCFNVTVSEVLERSDVLGSETRRNETRFTTAAGIAWMLNRKGPDVVNANDVRKCSLS